LQLEQLRNCIQRTPRSSNQAEADKTWNNLKIHFPAAYRQHRQRQGETIGSQAFANAAVTQASEDDLAEQALRAFANLATATAVDRNVVAQLMEANYRLLKQLEDNVTSLKEVKALLKKERAERASGGNTDRPPRRSFTPPPITIVGYMVTKWHVLTQAKIACILRSNTNVKKPNQHHGWISSQQRLTSRGDI
jgi:hypothetical protein